MNKRPDSDPDLNEDDIPDASELLDFELIAKSQPDKGQGLWLWVVLVLILAGGGWAGWMYLQGDGQETASADGVPLIMSPSFDLKEKPADPGGMAVPDRDKLVYDRMAGEGAVDEKGVERLLPPPETPIEPPQATVEVPTVETPAVEAPAAQAAPAQTGAPVALDAAAPAAPPAVPAEPAQVMPKAVAEPVAAPTPPAPAPAPKPAPVEASKPQTAFKATAPAGQGYLVQLSAVRTEQAAKDEWARMVKKNPDVLGGLEPVIQRADLGTKGIFYRVRGGWFTSRAEAKAICDELARRNVGCIIAKP